MKQLSNKTQVKTVNDKGNLLIARKNKVIRAKGMLFSMLTIGALLFSSCETKEEMEQKKPMQNFTLTIENIFTPKSFFSAGKTDGIGPGGMYSFSFDAGRGHYLSLATMLAQSNDLYFGFKDMGLSLYDMDGMPVTGDVTSMVYLWDAGTEVNEEPGKGMYQAPRQTGPNIGMDENGNVQKIMDVMDGFSYPEVGDMIKVMIAHDGGTMFTVTIKNMSDMLALTGPFAPGVWVVHTTDVMLYTNGQPASEGLERLAEDGNNAVLGDVLMMNAGLVSPFAPGVYAIYNGLNPIFKANKEASDALEALAEDGNPGMFDFNDIANVESWGAFTTPVSGSEAAPLFPGEKYKVMFTASQGDVLSFATMLVQSNDLFVAPEGVSLFTNGNPMSGDITMYLKLWDAMTEKNEAPGAGMYQAPRQSGANMGMDETGMVDMVNDMYTYPDVMDMLKVTLTLN